MTTQTYPESYEKIHRDRARLGRLHPDLMEGFMNMHQAATAPGALSKCTKELIALAIAITVRCDGCIACHVHDALEAGATKEEIVEAVGVAIMMGGGPSVVYGSAALDALNQFQPKI